MQQLTPLPLPDGVRSRTINNVNGLDMHLLEAGNPEYPCVLLLHGFPDLAFCWRGVLEPLADAGYHVIAPDLRGYGRTRLTDQSWQYEYSADIRPFSFRNLVKDLVALLFELRVKSLHCLVGHDFGSPLAAWTALMRPDLVQRLVLMSAPFGGAPPLTRRTDDMAAELLALTPPRKHYQHYYTSERANRDMLHSPQGLGGFLRAYFHVKSADWLENNPQELAGWTADELARMPHYYVMPAGQTMPEAVAPHLPEKPSTWLTDSELAVYTDEFARTGFQGGLNWYRASASDRFQSELSLYHGRKIIVPCWYMAGCADWGTYQSPGALTRMQDHVCTDFKGVHLLERAGHWVQQEQVAATTGLLQSVLQSPISH